MNLGSVYLEERNGKPCQNSERRSPWIRKPDGDASAVMR